MYKKLFPFLYESTKIDLHPISQYRHLHENVLLPISLIEIDTVAGVFPVLWRRTMEGAELCVLTGLEPNHNLAASDLSRFSRRHPLILRAYPFALAQGSDARHWQVLVDDAPAREGAPPLPLRAQSGELSAEAERRLTALKLFAESYPRTKELSQRLDAAGLLQPWDISLKIGGRFLGLEGLAVLDRDLVRRRRKLAGLVAQMGWDIIHLAAIHDLSLFKMQDLVDAQRVATA